MGNKIKTLTQITKLRPKFKFGGMTMIGLRFLLAQDSVVSEVGLDMLTEKQSLPTIMKIVLEEKMLKKKH
jgi:hypothetical protein